MNKTLNRLEDFNFLELYKKEQDPKVRIRFLGLQHKKEVESSLPPGPPGDNTVKKLQQVSQPDPSKNNASFFAVTGTLIASGAVAALTQIKDDIFGSCTKIAQVSSIFIFLLTGTFKLAHWLTRDTEETATPQVDFNNALH